jgi:dihydropteroate synthase
MTRTPFTWTLPRTQIELGRRTAVMGILNVTPDSFSDGGSHLELRKAVVRAHQIEQEGADILDIGGESSRPGSTPVSEEEEERRVLPVIDALAGRLRIPISIDTYRAGVARKALAAGAQIVNDISAFRFDPEMSDVVREAGAGVVLMHSRGSREELHRQPPMTDAIAEIRNDLENSLRAARDAGIPQTAIVLDPGIGFGKRAEESILVLRQLDMFSKLQYPLLVGPSRKSFIHSISAAAPELLLWGTAAAVAIAVARGAHVVRVHDVPQMRTFVDTLDAISEGGGTGRCTSSGPAGGPER